MNDDIEIRCEDLAARLASEDDLVLLDVRQAWESDWARIDGGTLITLQTLQARLVEIPRDREMVAYCHHGMRSLMAAKFLRQEGFRARSLKAGIDHWSIVVDPTTPRY
jgi:adenylyltransferase/sulfurtransferase